MVPMKRRVVATPLFGSNLQAYLDEYAQRGAVRFVERLWRNYREMVENISTFQMMSPARKRVIQGKRVVVREYVLHAGARDFLVLYNVPDDDSEAVILLNIRIGGQNHFKWKMPL